jgi:ribonuclease Z
MLKTFAMRGRDVPLTVYGPPGLRGLMSDLRRVYGRLTYDVRLHELHPSDAVEMGGWRIGAYAAVHRLEALGYALVEDERPGRFDPGLAAELGVPAGPEFGRLQRGEPVEVGGGGEVPGRVVEPRDVMGAPRPGRTVVFTGDTEPCEATVAVSRGADLLVHDGTFAEEETERARKTGHSTARQAAEVAERADVSLLALTHLSSRYFAPAIEKEAREVFERAVVPRDFDLIEVPYRERGEPHLVRWKEWRERNREPGEPVPQAP